MNRKALRLRLFQPSAHYRDPKCFQNDYINTLPLPARTTIAGMITYICDRRLESNIDIGVIGTHRSTQIEFSRGEQIDFWNEYRKLKKKNELKELLNGDYFDYYKDNIAGNSILNYEILKDMEMTIFFTCDSPEEFNFVKESLSAPGKYMNLGRKEDFVVPLKKGQFVEEVEIREFDSDNIRDCIRENIKLKNSYIKVDLRDNTKYKEVMNKGTLMALPSIYKDLKAGKNERVMEYSHYIYVGEDGIFPADLKVNVYESNGSKEVFAWL